MGYITENLMRDERVVYQTRLHWMIFASPVLLVVLAVLDFVLLVGGKEGFAPELALIFFILGAVLGLLRAIERQISEFGVTNRRVLVKTGMLRRRSFDINLGKVESVQVEQGMFGRMLDYGRIVVVGSGGSRQSFKKVTDPLALRMHVQDQVEKRTRTDAASIGVPGREERECPHCAEPILAKAKICKHCGREVHRVMA
jgi:uncharacterized membrane protein YdbT with pleckstrin-like domain